MYEMLRRHPQIFMPDIKEPRFMASDLRSRRPKDSVTRNPETAEEYLALFAGAKPGQLAGEASATYLFSRAAAAQIAEIRPRAKIIAMLREPVSFLHSLHTTYLQIHFEDERDLGRAIALEPARRAGERIPPRAYIPQLLQYSEQVRYVEQLRRYEAHFDDADLLVLIYDDFRNGNQATMQRVLRFLGVEDAGSLETLEANVTTWSYRAPRLDGILTGAALGRTGAWRPVKKAAKALSTQRLRHRALRMLRRRIVLTEPPRLATDLESELRERFKPEVLALSEHLGRDLLSLWNYD